MALVIFLAVYRQRRFGWKNGFSCCRLARQVCLSEAKADTRKNPSPFFLGAGALRLFSFDKFNA